MTADAYPEFETSGSAAAGERPRQTPPRSVAGSGWYWTGLLLVAVGAVCLTVLPNVWARLHYGAWFWIPNHDGWIYLQVLALARKHGWPSPYGWLLFSPATLLARLVHAGPAGLTALWNLQAALVTSVPLYLYLNHVLSHGEMRGRAARRAALLATAAALLWIFDCGVMRYTPLLSQAGLLWNATHGASLWRLPYPPVFHQWDVLSPGLWLGYLFLFLWLARRARERQVWQRTLAAMAAFGCTFYVMFYLWTAVLGALALLVLFNCWRLRSDEPATQRSAKLWLSIAVGGGALGAPALLWQWIRHSGMDWLHRNGLFVASFRHEPFHAGNLLLYGLSLAWLWRRDRDLLPLWCTCLSAWLLFFLPPIIFGLEMQDFHWLYVRNPLLYLLWIVLLLRTWTRLQARARQRCAWIFAALLVLVVTSGLFLRQLQAAESRDARRAVAQWQTWSAQFPENGKQASALPRVPAVPLLQAGAVAGGDPGFVRLAVIRAGLQPLSGDPVLLNPRLTNQDWMERIALNIYLQAGRDEVAQKRVLDAYMGRQERIHSELPWTLPAGRERFRARLRQDLVDLQRHPQRWLRRYHVRYAGLAAGPALPQYLRHGWRLIVAGPRWQVWERS